MKRLPTVVAVMVLLPALVQAQGECTDPPGHGLPRLLFNDDGDDLRSPAYGLPDLWVPAGQRPPIQPVRTVADCLGYRIAPLADTAAKGLSYCGNFGVPVWDLPPARLAALGSDPLVPVTFSANELDQWVTLAHRHRVPVYGVLDRMNFRGKAFARYGTPETLRAAVATLWRKGADGLYFFNYYLPGEYPLLGEFADRARLARLPKEYFLDANHGTAFNGTVSSGPLPVGMKAGSTASVSLLVADDPAQAGDLRLELVWEGTGDLEPPAVRLNGHPLHGLRVRRCETGCIVSGGVSELGRALRLGQNQFVLAASTAATLVSLSVAVVP